MRPEWVQPTKEKPVKKWLAELKRNQVGQVIPVVLVLLALGSLMVLPMLNYMSTSLKSGEVIEKKERALYAADAGIEDALQMIKDPLQWPLIFPEYSYTLMEGIEPANINGMQVQVDITLPGDFMGGPIQAKNPNAPNTQTENLKVSDIEITDSGPLYTCDFNVTNVEEETGPGRIWIIIIRAFFQETVYYEDDSTMLDGEFFDGSQPPTTDTKLLVWGDFNTKLFDILKGETRNFSFQVNGPSDGINSPFIAVTAIEESIGTVMGLGPGEGEASFIQITSTATDFYDYTQHAKIVTDALMSYTIDGSDVIVGEVRIIDWIIDKETE